MTFLEKVPMPPPPLPKGSRIEVELMRGVIQGMALLGQGERAASRRVATQLAARARHTGYRLYLAEAEQLLALIDNPPPLGDLVRSVCCIRWEKPVNSL